MLDLAAVRLTRHTGKNVPAPASVCLGAGEARVVSVADDTSRGFGVRVIARGTWGFAASSQLTRAEVVRVARQAVAMAKTNSALQREPVQLAPAERHVAV